jgi:hypothetical protein
MNVDDGASPADSMLNELRAAVPAKHVEGVKSSLATSETASVSLETCRWLPLRAYLNWGIDSLKLVIPK